MPDLGSIFGQLQKAHSDAQNSKPASPTGGVLDWIKSQQKQAANSSAEAAKAAAAQSAKKSLGDFLTWAKSQAEKASQAAKATSHQAPAEQAKHEEDARKAAQAKATVEKGLQEAAQKAQGAWKQLVEVAQKAARKTAEEEAPRIVAQTAKAKEEAQALSKAAVDSSIQEAEARIRAAGSSGDAAAKEAAEAASRRALETLFSWAKADEMPRQEKAAEAEHDAGSPIADAWAMAHRAEATATATERLAESVDSIAEKAERAAEQGHDEAKALWKTGLPGAAGAAALKKLKEVVGDANATVHQSDRASDIARYVKNLLLRAIDAARRASNVDDFRMAWVAVKRAYHAAFKAQEDSRVALTHSRDATLAVSAALAEAGWRAVGEVLRSEVHLLLKVAGKAAKEREVARLGAWLEGLSQAQPVAKAAWLKGFSEGMQTSAASHGTVGKVQQAGKSVGKAGAEWIKAVARAIASKDARGAVARAASSATRAASAAAMAAAGTAADGFRAGLQEQVKSGLLKAATPKGTTFEAAGEWKKEGRYKGDVSGSYQGKDFKGQLFFEPNATHERVMLRGQVTEHSQNLLETHGVAAVSKTGTASNKVRYVVNGPKVLWRPTGTAASFRSDPIAPGASYVKSSAGAWGLANTLKADYEGLASEHDGAKGKIGVTFSSPSLRKPFHFSTSFSKQAEKQTQR